MLFNNPAVGGAPLYQGVRRDTGMSIWSYVEFKKENTIFSWSSSKVERKKD